MQVDDLKIIKKKYGEDLSKLCRSLFPTLLETPGLLSNFLLERFEPTRFLYDDLKKYNEIDKFQKYVYASLLQKKELKLDNILSPEELLDKAGYILKEVKTYQELQSYVKYYREDELLCSFKQEGRLDRCRVFFAVKKNVDEIRRENFTKPERQDEYGVSVISIQFTHDDAHILSIKNRYNHHVDMPDATFSNNLDNIIDGLTASFSKYYGLEENYGKIMLNLYKYMEVDKKRYRYNYYFNKNGNQVYFCPNNIIIVNKKVYKYDKEKYLLIDYFLLDLVNKKIILTENIGENDGFLENLNNIEKITITNENNNKKVIIKTNNVNIEIILNEYNQVISYKNDKLENLYNFLEENKVLQNIEIKNVKKIASRALMNKQIEQIYLPESLEEIGEKAFYCLKLKEIKIPSKVKKINKYSFYGNKIESLVIPDNIEEISDYAFVTNGLKHVKLSKNLKSIGLMAFFNNQIEELILPEKIELINNCAFKGNKIKELKIPKSLKKISHSSFGSNQLEKLILHDELEIIETASFTMNNINNVEINENTKVENYAFDQQTEIIIKNNKTK